MYGVGTWTTTKDNEQMIRTTQRFMLCLIMLTEGKDSKALGGKDIQDDEMSEDTN